MVPKFHSAQANIAFDKLMLDIERQLHQRVGAAFGYSAQTVQERLAQQIVETAFWPFVSKCMRRVEMGKEPLQDSGEPVEFGGIRFDPASGSVQLSIRLILRSIAIFLRSWLAVFCGLLSSWRGRTMAFGMQSTLVFGIGLDAVLHDGSDARFVDYCKNGPISVLTAAKQLIIQSTVVRLSDDPRKVQYHRFPIIALLQQSISGFRNRTYLVLLHIAFSLRFLTNVIRDPLLLLLARDAAFIPSVQWLDKRRLIEAIVLTNSTYESQALWMRDTEGRSFRVHMVWYSQNTIPVVLQEDKTQSDLPNYRHLFADVHWIWTSAYAEYLRRLCRARELYVVGPVLWYRPELPKSELPGAIKVVIFDVTPVRDEWARKTGLLYNYYSCENMIGFIEQTLAVSKEVAKTLGRPVHLLLKHKRDHHDRHDPRYLELIRNLCVPNGLVELLPSSANIYSILASSDLAVVVPYSSPALVADHVGVPSIYFDPTRELLPTFHKSPMVRFASGQEELLAETQSILSRASSFRWHGQMDRQ